MSADRDGLEPWQLTGPGKGPTVRLQEMCKRHQAELIHARLHLSPTGPWQMALVTCGMLLFRRLAALPAIVARTEGDAHALSLVLAEIGCMACYAPDAFTDAAGLIRARGWKHGFDVAMHRATDPRFPLEGPPA